MTTLQDFALQCLRFPKDLEQAQRLALKAAAATVDTAVLASAQAQRWPAKANWLRDRVLADTATVELRGGFPYMFEGGAKRHTITPKQYSKRTIARRAAKGNPVTQHQALRTPFGPRTVVQSPGFKGRPFWNPGIAAAAPLVNKEFQTALQVTLARVFR